MEIFKIEDLSFTYKGCDEPALQNVSLSIQSGAFVTVSGPTGSGKSTLLRLLKKEISPDGTITGLITYKGKPLSELSPRDSAEQISFVMQRPEEQIVSDRVSAELFFAPECLGLKRDEAADRVAEAADMFGFQTELDNNTFELSGGKKQLLALCSSLVMSPSVILLDEPTSRLDPLASSELLSILVRLNRELGVTVIIAEHDTSRILQYTDTLVFIEDGRLTACGSPEEVLSERPSDKLLSDMPASVRLYFDNKMSGTCPLNVKDAKKAFSSFGFKSAEKVFVPDEEAVRLDNVFFSYSRASKDVLKGVSLGVCKGEIRFIFGGNGCGKSTLLGCISGALKPYSGKLRLLGKKLSEYKNGSLYSGVVSMLYQDPTLVFTRETLEDEFRGIDTDALPFDVTPFFKRHPYDLSGGEQQLAALCRTLAAKPSILLLDEPGSGMDAYHKKQLCDVLIRLKSEGVTVIAVSHDTELAAACADRCSMMFDGRVVCTDGTLEFMRRHKFYTTDTCRISGGCAI